MTPIEILQDVELRNELLHSLELLPHRDKTIVEMIFGIGDFNPTTQVEIAKHFNISAPRVHQIQNKMLRNLRAKIGVSR